MRNINILETNILHASDVIYWLDGSSAEDPVDMYRVNLPVSWLLNDSPSDLQVLHSEGKTALWRRPDTEIINGEANTADKTAPSEPAYTVAGTVSDPTGRYNPRSFSFNAGSAAAHGLALYPTPFGTRFSKAGGLIGTMRFSADLSLVPWALLVLQVTIATDDTLIFRAQTDSNADFMLSMGSLPPLPEGVDNFAAQLSAFAAPPGSDPQVAVDPDTLPAVSLGELDNPDSFSNPINFTVVPGEIRLIRTQGKDHLAVLPS